MLVLPRFFILWPWVDLDLFYVEVKFGHIGFWLGESENYLFFGNYCSIRSQSCLKHSGKWVNEVEWVWKVKVILWPWSTVTQISKLNVWLWPVYSGLMALLFKFAYTILIYFFRIVINQHILCSFSRDLDMMTQYLTKFSKPCLFVHVVIAREYISKDKTLTTCSNTYNK